MDLTTDRGVLEELVALKDMKDEELRSRQRRPVRDREKIAACDAMRIEYLRRKPIAWAAARARLAQPEVAPTFDRTSAVVLMSAAAKSGDPGAISLAAQLAGAAPCEKCNYVRLHCRCAKTDLETWSTNMGRIESQAGFPDMSVGPAQPEFSGDAPDLPLDDDMPLGQAESLAALWRDGKLIGGDPYEACLALLREVERLRSVLNTPELQDFSRAVALEAAHQRERWGSDHDAGKQPSDWFWLLGYLGGKALHSAIAGDVDKAKHHTISSAAAMANWHAALSGDNTRMRPGTKRDGE